jgi:hypothetical protein
MLPGSIMVCSNQNAQYNYFNDPQLLYCLAWLKNRNPCIYSTSSFQMSWRVTRIPPYQLNNLNRVKILTAMCNFGKMKLYGFLEDTYSFILHHLQIGDELRHWTSIKLIWRISEAGRIIIIIRVFKRISLNMNPGSQDKKGTLVRFPL